MLDRTNDKGGLAEERAFKQAYPCMIQDDQGYDGEYRCGYHRYDVKSGYRPETGNVVVAAYQFLLQVDRGNISNIARIDGIWRELDAAEFINSRPRLIPPKRGYSDTCYVKAPEVYWKNFTHNH